MKWRGESIKGLLGDAMEFNINSSTSLLTGILQGELRRRKRSG
jgi:hypothetical protein